MVKETYLQIETIENGITVFRLLDNNRAAVDAFFEALWNSQKDLKGDVLFRFVVDISKVQVFPIAYCMEKNRQWVQAHPSVKPNRAVVIIAEGNSLRSMLISFSNVIMHRAINRLEVRVFSTNEHEKAIEWLLKDG